MRTMLFQPWALSLSLKLLCFALILKSFFTVFWWLLTVKVTKSLLILFCRLNGNVIAKFLNLSLIIYLKLFFSNSFSHLTGNNKKRYTHLCVCGGGGTQTWVGSFLLLRWCLSYHKNMSMPRGWPYTLVILNIWRD